MIKLTYPEAMEAVKDIMRNQYDNMSKGMLIDLVMDHAGKDLLGMHVDVLHELLATLSVGQLGIDKEKLGN